MRYPAPFISCRTLWEILVFPLVILSFILTDSSDSAQAGDTDPNAALNHSHSTLIIGHQGAAGLAPGNTLAGVSLAIDLGIDAIELDIMLSADATLVVHPKGAPHLIDPAKLTAGATAVYGEAAFARDFGHLVPVPEGRVKVAEDGMRVNLAGRELTFLDTPGHANHHGCIFDATTRGFFTGDTFGISYREFDNAFGPLLSA